MAAVFYKSGCVRRLALSFFFVHLLFFLLTSAPLLCSSMAEASDAKGRVFTRFRCMRPFKSMKDFRNASLKAKDNCNFKIFNITNATVVTRCVAGETTNMTVGVEPQSDAEQHTCSVTLRMTFRLNVPNALSRNVPKRYNMAASDAYRFSMRLRAVNHSSVMYDGFDDNGFSACCDLLQEAVCSWDDGDEGAGPASGQSDRKIVSCPLYDAVQPGGTFHGIIQRPLHRNVLTEWQIIVGFWQSLQDQQKQLGRIVVPFALTKEDLLSINASAAELSSVVMVPVKTKLNDSQPVTSEKQKKRDGHEDL